ncbi:MAG: hypothetical protein EZS28_049074 [Streblomastix strix]|uniref:Uncharacterized protein n=1 Tax=Streblomastix strix TaxID=222440 RepID=A0A5J4TB83_9EUKA|nr:MAG: hypothetical protein EZS28_049074 [Streblomastix strix]
MYRSQTDDPKLIPLVIIPPTGPSAGAINTLDDYGDITTGLSTENEYYFVDPFTIKQPTKVSVRQESPTVIIIVAGKASQLLFKGTNASGIGDTG